jgi:hypothetical protein
MPKKVSSVEELGEIIHNWEVREYEEYRRNGRWYILMVILCVLLVVYGIFTQNFLFSIIIILFAVILYFREHRSPELIPFAITEEGILIGQNFYEYDELGKFHILYNPPTVTNLYIETKTVARPNLVVPIYENNPLELRLTLQDYLEENLEKQKEPITEEILRTWRLE